MRDTICQAASFGEPDEPQPPAKKTSGEKHKSGGQNDVSAPNLVTDDGSSVGYPVSGPDHAQV